MDVINKSSFKYSVFKKQGPSSLLDILVVKATFDLQPHQPITLSDTQDDILLSDEFDGPTSPHPLRSVVSSEGDLVAFKPETDLIITGTAEAFNGEPVEFWEVNVALGPINKRLNLHGPETFYRHSDLHPWVSGGITPTSKITLDDRLSLGGCFAADPDDLDLTCHFPQNPAGTGWLPRAEDLESLAEHQKRYVLDQCNEIKEIQAPQIRSPLDRYHPENTGCFINLSARPRWTTPRCDFQGTYDRHWLMDRYPGYPANFDPLYFQAAEEDQRINPWLKGDEALSLKGLFKEGDCHFTLPQIGILAIVSKADGDQFITLPVLDTVRIDLDRRKLNLVWRMHGDQANPITEITFTDYPVNQLQGGVWS